MAAKLKKECQRSLVFEMFKLPQITRPGVYNFTWFVTSQRIDPDNIAFGKKFVLDALQEAGKLPNDSLKWVLGFEDHFVQHENPHLNVEIIFYESE